MFFCDFWVKGDEMKYNKCLRCGAEFDKNLSQCNECGFVFDNLERDTNAQIFVGDVANPFDYENPVMIVDKEGGEIMLEGHYGDILSLKLNGPTTILILKTGWKSIKTTLYPTYKPAFRINFKDSFLSKKMKLLDISGDREDEA